MASGRRQPVRFRDFSKSLRLTSKFEYSPRNQFLAFKFFEKFQS